MNRAVGYVLGSIFLSGTLFYFPLKSSTQQGSADYSSTQKQTNPRKFGDGFPSESLIDVDAFGNILISDRNNKKVRVIHPSGAVSTLGAGGQEAPFQLVPGSYSAGMANAGLYTPGGMNLDSGYFGSGGSGNSGSEGGNSIRIKKMNRELAEDPSTVLRGSHPSESAKPGTGAGVPGSTFSSNTGFTPEKLVMNAPVSMQSPWKNSGAPMVLPVSEGTANPLVGQVELPTNATGSSDNNSSSNEPDFIPVTVGSKGKNKPNEPKSMQAMQPPDRRQNAGQAEDAAKNAIPPIMQQAEDEKEKARQEREKTPPNEGKAQEHDSKAAALLAQAAAMAAAMAGNNNAKNKAGNDDGGSTSQPVQIPVYSFGTENKNSDENEKETPLVIMIPNPNKPFKP